MDYALTIDGLPYYATTGTLPVVLWNELNDPDEPRGATALTALEMPKGGWTERMRLVEGDLEVGGMTFELHDVTPSTGIAAGQPWLTWLASRQPIEIDSAILSTTMTAAATTFVLTSTSASAVSGSIPCVLWVDDEAINCASYNGGTQTVTVATDGRGYYGTKAKAHTVDVEFGVVPEAWVAPPWINRRRVLLWRIDDAAGTAHVVWRGYANRPRLSPNGASWQLQCEPAWTVDRARPLGIPTASTRVRGYSPSVIAFGALTGNTLNLFGTSTARDATAGIFGTLDELLSWAKTSLHAQLAGISGVTSAVVDLQRFRSQVTLRLQLTSVDPLLPPYRPRYIAAQISVAGEVTTGPVTTTDPQVSSCEADMPSAAISLPLDYDEANPPSIPVTTTVGLSSIAAATPLTNGPHTTSVQTALIGKVDENTLLVVYVTATDPDDTTLNGPSITGGFRFFDAKTGRVIDDRYDGVRRSHAVILSAVRLQLGARVTTTHWAYGLAGLLADSSHARGGFDTRNFDTGSLGAVARITENENAGRDWNLTGEQTLGDLVVPTLAADGCCPAIVADGKVGFAALRNPLINETVAATFTSANFVAGTRALWEDGPAGIVNVATLEVGDSKVTINDQRSIGRYGQGRVASFKLQGLEYAGDISDARVLGSRLLSRILQVFGEPVAVVKWTTPMGASGGSVGFLDAAYCGDIVAVTDATTPNGVGGRVNTLRRCQVIARTIDLARGTIQWEALALPVAYAYAPAIRVTSISGAVITADYQYVLEGGGDATDYAGTTTGSGGNRGVTKFVAGDRVKLLLRDSTTYDYYSAVVLSVNGGAGTITLTASVPTTPTDWPAVCGTGMVDLVYDDYETSGIQAAQKQYAYGGGGNAVWGGIGATTDKSRRWGA